MLTEERRKQVFERLAGLVAAMDPEVQLLEVVLDSTREQLAVILQKGEWPLVLAMNWMEFVSASDDALRHGLREKLAERIRAAGLGQAGQTA